MLYPTANTSTLHPALIHQHQHGIYSGTLPWCTQILPHSFSIPYYSHTVVAIFDSIVRTGPTSMNFDDLHTHMHTNYHTTQHTH